MNRIDRMNKKAYMFTLDLTIAIVVLVIGVAIIFYNFISSNKTIYFTEQLSEDIIGVMAYTNLDDICTNLGSDDCNCPKYPNIAIMACNRAPCETPLKDFDTNVLSMISERITTHSCPGNVVEDVIREIFVTKNVIDEKRFGFAVLYQGIGMPLLELYNTETYPYESHSP
jgi:flagellar basal body-associated protein FliL